VGARCSSRQADAPDDVPGEARQQWRPSAGEEAENACHTEEEHLVPLRGRSTRAVRVHSSRECALILKKTIAVMMPQGGQRVAQRDDDGYTEIFEGTAR